MNPLIFVALVVFSAAVGLQDPEKHPAKDRYAVVIRAGRVVDPEQAWTGVMLVGITGGTIARIAPDSLTGTRFIDAGGLVLAPGFIDPAVNSALFKPGWRERLGIDYKDLQLVETGERLTRRLERPPAGGPISLDTVWQR